MTKVSFIAVAYRSNDDLPILIKSIQSQTGDFVRELIVIDNCQKESCRELAITLEPTAKVLVNPENVGYTRAINQAIENAGGEYLFLLNPDIELQPNVTELLIASIQRDKSVGAAAPKLLNGDKTTQPSIRNFPTFSTLLWEHSGLAALFPKNKIFGRWKNRYFAYNTWSVVEQPMASAMMIRAEATKSVGGWDEQFFVFFSDVDYCKRLSNAGYKIVFEPQAVAFHKRGGATHKEGTWLIWDAHRGFYRYLAKHELVGWKKFLRAKAWTMLMISAALRVAYRKLTGRLF